MTFRSDADVFGFRASDIFDFLDTHGLKLNRDAHAANANEPDRARPKESVMPQNVPRPRVNDSSELSTFSAIAAAKRAEFISYREVMTKLAEFPGDSLREIATVLKLHGVHKSRMAWLCGQEKAVTEITSDDYLCVLLDATIQHGEICNAWDEAGNEADPDLFGWKRNGLIFDLREIHELPCPDSLETPAVSPPNTDAPPVPDWVKPYIGRRDISLGDASEILAGFEPIPSHEIWGEGAWAKIDRWQSALIDAVGDGVGPEFEIAGSTWGSNRYSEQMLSHSDIRAWCARRGHTWPIPELNPQSAIESDEFAEGSSPSLPAKLALYEGLLKEAKAEAERIRAELVEAGEKDVRQAREEVEKYRELNEKLAAELDRLSRAQQATEGDNEARAEIERLRDELSAARQALDEQKDKGDHFAAWLYDLTRQILGEKNAAQLSIGQLHVAHDSELAALQQKLTAAANGQTNDAAALDERVTQLTSDLEAARREVGRLRACVPAQPVWLMEMVMAVQRRYWGDNWKAGDRDTWASQADILQWIKRTYPNLSELQRKAIELVACPVDRNPSAKRQP